MWETPQDCIIWPGLKPECEGPHGSIQIQISLDFRQLLFKPKNEKLIYVYDQIQQDKVAP